MGKLAALGLVIMGGFGSPPAVTSQAAIRAIRHAMWFAPSTTVTCAPSGRGQVCQLVDSIPYADQVLGTAEVVGTTTVGVFPGRHGDRVRVLVPDHFEIYAAPTV